MEEGRRPSVGSAGAFDVTVQPLWRLYEAHFGSGSAGRANDILARAHDVAQALVDYRAVEIGAGRIAFARPGMAATLNSLAQGFITDAAADLLRNEGFETTFVVLGGIRALGRHPVGRRRRVGSASAGPGQRGRRKRRERRSCSGTGGADDQARGRRDSGVQRLTAAFRASGRSGHIFECDDGRRRTRPDRRRRDRPAATVADGLSTASASPARARAAALLRGLPGYQAILTGPTARARKPLPPSAKARSGRFADFALDPVGLQPHPDKRNCAVSGPPSLSALRRHSGRTSARTGSPRG